MDPIILISLATFVSVAVITFVILNDATEISSEAGANPFSQDDQQRPLDDFGDDESLEHQVQMQEETKFQNDEQANTNIKKPDENEPSELKSCRACGNMLWKQAKVCPQCGCENPIPREPEPDSLFDKIMMALPVVFVASCMVVNFGESGGNYQYQTQPPSNSKLRDLGLSDEEIKHLKRLPSLRGYSDQEKEQIIEGAAKFERALKAKGKW